MAITDIDFSKLTCIGEGRNRRVYLLPSGKNVIKVPLNDDGIRDNCLEDHRFRLHRSKWYPLARCRLLDFAKYYLIMEYTEPQYNLCELMKLHNWVGMVDCCQVGLTSKNKLVAFDYGN